MMVTDITFMLYTDKVMVPLVRGIILWLFFYTTVWAAVQFYKHRDKEVRMISMGRKQEGKVLND